MYFVLKFPKVYDCWLPFNISACFPHQKKSLGSEESCQNCCNHIEMKAEVDSSEHSSSQCVSFNVFSFEEGSLNAFGKFLEKQAFLFTKRECRLWVVDVNCVSVPFYSTGICRLTCNSFLGNKCKECNKC